MSAYRRDYGTAWFHVDFGPPSLFERVRFKMACVHTLFFGKHFNRRAAERDVSSAVLDELTHFDSSRWVLRMAEVRTDRGKFVNSTWEIICDGEAYWVSIGVGNYIKTVYRCGPTSGLGKCVRYGELYEFVEKVNRELMDAEPGVRGEKLAHT